jgi:signal transduction histidine kinase
MAEAAGGAEGPAAGWWAVARARLRALRAELADVLGPRGWTAQEQALWLAEARQVDARSGARIFLTLAVANLLWWPLDSWVLAEDPVVRAAYATHRPWVTPILLALVGLQRLPGLRGRPLLGFGLLGGLTYGWLCWAFGDVGGPGAPWIHLAPLLAAPSAGVAAPPLRRALTLVWVFGCGLVGFFLLHPAHMEDPHARLVVSYTGFAAALSFAGGIIIDGLRRSNFRLRRDLSARAAELDALNGALSQRVADQTAALTTLTGELRSLLAHTERAREDERAHLSRELHDELGQELTGLRFALELTRRRYAREPASVAHNLEQLDELLAHTATAARALVRDLRPALLDDLHLLDALRWLVERAGERGGPPVSLEVEGEPAALDAVGPGPAGVVAFRAAQEALTNVARHAEASRAAVRVGVDGQDIVLIIDDDGKGLHAARPDGPPAGFGLVGMRERARAVGGRMELGPSPLGGARVALRLPLHGKGEGR